VLLGVIECVTYKRPQGILTAGLYHLSRQHDKHDLVFIQNVKSGSPSAIHGIPRLNHCPPPRQDVKPAATSMVGWPSRPWPAR
jgi:hypothetical protein